MGQEPGARQPAGWGAMLGCSRCRGGRHLGSVVLSLGIRAERPTSPGCCGAKRAHVQEVAS